MIRNKNNPLFPFFICYSLVNNLTFVQFNLWPAVEARITQFSLKNGFAGTLLKKDCGKQHGYELG